MEANEILNQFTKGIIADYDPLVIAGNQWVFPTLNIRISNKKGQGFIATVIDGNNFEFALSDGFLALGSCENNGICYIASYNKTKNWGEIGCYPSPRDIDFAYNQPNTTTPPPQPPSFQRQYRPLLNFTSGTAVPEITDTRVYMRTPAFNFDLEHQISMFAKESYDGSVDLYLADYKNPNRVINSGFTQEGKFLNRLYWYNDFFSNINQIQVTGTVLDADLNTIETGSGGSLEYGVYFAHFRYADANSNSTPFVFESNACQIFDGNINSIIDVQGGECTEVSDKIIKFDLTDVDTSYAFIQVVLTKFYSNTFGVMMHDSYLIGTDYNITGSVMSLTITGRETMIPFDEALLSLPTATEVCCKDHIQINNRYYGANWKSSQRYHEALKKFALKITVSFDDNLTKDAGVMNPLLSAGGQPDSLGQYTDFEFTYGHVGHFRGETYPFGIMAEMIDGSLSDVFPVIGKDEYLGLLGGGVTNSEGIYRFPKQEFSPAFVDNKIHVLGVKFDNNDAITWLNDNTDPDVLWFKSNVRAIYYVRGQRRETLVAQGLAMNVSKAYIDLNEPMAKVHLTSLCNIENDPAIIGAHANVHNDQSDSTYNGQKQYGQMAYNCVDGGHVSTTWWSIDYTDPENNDVNHVYKGGLLFPLYRGYMPMFHAKLDWGSKRFRYYTSRWFLQPDKYAFYSPDTMFNPLGADVANFKYIKRVGKTIDPAGTIVNDKWTKEQTWPNLSPKFDFCEMEDEMIVSGVDRNIDEITNAYNIGAPNTHGPQNPHNSYCNWFGSIDDGWGAADAGMYIEKHVANLGGSGYHPLVWSNRDIYSPAYIAIEIPDGTDGYDNNLQNYNLDIVNVYKENIDDPAYDILNLYSITPPNTNVNLWYSKISNPIKMDYTIPGHGLDNETVLYKGDCFLQKFYFKQRTWLHSDWKDSDVAIVGYTVSDSVSTYPDFNMSDPSPWIDTPDTSVVGDNTIKNRYAHGCILGIVVECKINSAMRHSNPANGASFYPRTPLSKNWSIFPNYNAGAEALMYNYGYHRQESLHVWPHYNPYLLDQVKAFKTRIRHTPLNIPYAFTDAYRVFNSGDYKDYDLQYGQINALINYHSKLVSVQEGALNEHYFDQSQLKTPSTPGDLIMGLGPILSQSVRVLAEYGSQHQWSVNKMGFGVDWRRRTIWGLGLASSDTGGTYVTAMNMGITFGIEKWIYELFDSYDSRTDILNSLPDTPVNGLGIVTGYDPKYKDVIFTFLLKIITGFTFLYSKMRPNMLIIINQHGGLGPDGTSAWLESLPWQIYTPGAHYDAGTLVYNQSNHIMYYYEQESVFGKDAWIPATPIYEDISRSLVYNMSHQAFIGEVSFMPNIYLNINDDFFSNKEGSIFLHNSSSPAYFYGEQYKGILSYIVNGGAQNSDNEKIFTDLMLESSDEAFSRIIYETEYQTAIHNGDTVDDFRTAEFWRNPEYNVKRWEMPIYVQTSGQDNAFNTESEMRGAWMKVTVEYFKNIPQYLKKSVVKFIIGKNY